jgi:hypothetical protein
MTCVNTSPTPAIRFLGVYFDPHLNFKHHIQLLINKLSRTLYFLLSVKNILTFNAFKSIYYSLFHSHLIYGIHVWSCTNPSNLNPLIIKQKMAVRLLFNAKYNAHTETLIKAAKILPLTISVTSSKFSLCNNFPKVFYQSLSLTLGLQMLFGVSTSPK